MSEYAKKKIVQQALCLILVVVVILFLQVFLGRKFNFNIQGNHLIFLVVWCGYGMLGYYWKVALLGRLKELDDKKFNAMNLQLKYFGGGEGPREAGNLIKFIFGNDDFGDSKVRYYKNLLKLEVILFPVFCIGLIFLFGN